MSDEETKTLVVPTAEELGAGSEAPEVGQWYWTTDTEEHAASRGREARRLWCVVRVGSNYVALSAPDYGTWRVHFDEFWKTLERERNPDKVINDKVEGYQAKVRELMAEVQALTARLCVSTAPSLEGTTQALAITRGGGDPAAYKLALKKAEHEELPELFRQIKDAHEKSATWMKAKLIPLEAESDGLKKVIEVVSGRIFTVELYAGLIEGVVQCADGTPAAYDEPIHLLQRRHYMDEECLFSYDHGGMDNNKTEDFDRWMARPKNRDRILPFPRCIVAFRVRRNEKERAATNIGDFISFWYEAEADRQTFLYIRNGEQLYRLQTGIDFGEKLFPDLGKGILDGTEPLWARMDDYDYAKVEELTTEGDYLARKKAWKEAKEAHAVKVAEYKAAKAAAPTDLEKRALRQPYLSDHDGEQLKRFKPFNSSSVYFDDMTAYAHGLMEAHNRVLIVLQGLLDRSPALHPHPQWALWSAEGFDQAVKLVFDDSRALVPGEAPDFEAYRRELNLTLKTGSVTVGQDDAWELHEGKKEQDRRDHSRSRFDRDLPETKRFRPENNPGPGLVAKVAKYSTRTRSALFTWERERADNWRTPKWRRKTTPLKCTITVSEDRLLNVSAYKPGDYRRFFADPRTRADYLVWAPMLLACEEYYAGNLALGGEFHKTKAPEAEETDDDEAEDEALPATRDDDQASSDLDDADDADDEAEEPDDEAEDEDGESNGDAAGAADEEVFGDNEDDEDFGLDEDDDEADNE